MEDSQIISLYFARSEQAIQETDRKYGKLCYGIAHRILDSREDAEESVSDTYMTAWKEIPPAKPRALGGFLAKIVRCISINKWQARCADKRGGGQIQVALDELQDCADGKADVEKICESKEMIASYRRFLGSLKENERSVFLRRYFFLDSVAEISKMFGFTESKVTSMLFRLRVRLKNHLTEEGYL